MGELRGVITYVAISRRSKAAHGDALAGRYEVERKVGPVAKPRATYDIFADGGPARHFRVAS